MPDKVETLGHSVIQHGDDNARVYLMKLDHRDRQKIIGDIERLAQRNRYGKIFCKVPAWAKSLFERHHYRLRAHVPGFYQGEQDVFFMSKFLKLDRKHLSEDTEDRILAHLKLAKSKAGESAVMQIPDGYRLQRLDTAHLEALAGLYDAVYASYPFPITDPAYLKETMDANVDYFGVVHDGALIAASSAEKDSGAGNAEMTDFATLPEHRGRGLATALLMEMESEMQKQGMKTLFTIARALSAGINITFAKCGYQYSGTLINNTQIAGRIESMNVWYKRLVASSESD